MLSDTVTECRQVDPGEQRFALAKHDRGQREMELVDQPGAEILTDGLHATANLDVTPASGELRLF